jgi:hypothetical protein
MNARWSALALATAAALTLGGCAVQQGRPGQIKVGLDIPEMLGERLAAFKLADGSEGHLRVLAGQYSIKLQRYLKVVDIKPAQAVRLLRTEYFGDRTVLVLEKSNGNCTSRMELLLIRGSDISSWDFGECREPLQIERDGDALYFDRVAGNRLERIVYRDERMVRLRPVALNAPAPTAGMPSAPGVPRPTVRTRPGDPPPIVDAATQRHTPGPPIPAADFKAAMSSEPFLPEVRTAQAPAPATANRPAPAPAQTARPRTEAAERPQAAPPPRPRGLPGEVAEDMQPIRIKLE